MPTHKTVEDLCNEECKGRFCMVKFALEHDGGMKDRVLEQMAVMGVFKYKINQEYDYELGWNEVGRRWIEEGYARRFAEAYKDGMKRDEIWAKMNKPNKE